MNHALSTNPEPGTGRSDRGWKGRSLDSPCSTPPKDDSNEAIQHILSLVLGCYIFFEDSAIILEMKD